MSSSKRKRAVEAPVPTGTTADLFAGIERRSTGKSSGAGKAGSSFGGVGDGGGGSSRGKKKARVDPRGSLETATQSDLEFSRLLDQFTSEQLQRYEFFRRSSLPKQKVRKFMEEVLAGAGVGPRAVVKAGDLNTSSRSAAVGGSDSSPSSVKDKDRPVDTVVAIVMAGICKVFLGELVETARLVMEERGEEGAICPRHVREAYRRQVRSGRVPYIPTNV